MDRRAWVLLLIVTSPFCAPFAKGLAEKSSIRDEPRTPTDRGIGYAASLDKTEYRVGDPIRLSLSFENPTDAEVTLWHSGFWPNHQVVLRDDSGREAPLTEAGRQKRAAFAPEGARDKNAPRRLAPSEEYREAAGIDLPELYQLDRGTYKLVVIYHDMQRPTPLRVATRSIEFKVR